VTEGSQGGPKGSGGGTALRPELGQGVGKACRTSLRVENPNVQPKRRSGNLGENGGRDTVPRIRWTKTENRPGGWPRAWGAVGKSHGAAPGDFGPGVFPHTCGDEKRTRVH